ncbi:MAG: signal recognition particle protein Srp19 [Methanocellales archaeon]|nr:signal recognition particle protein Srp19 [Methanocellales archaeon]
MQNKGKMVIWPAYIDNSKPKSGGRIVPKKDGVCAPRLEEIEMAAKNMGLNPTVEPDKAYPKSAWEISGRVIVDDKGPKSLIAKKIANDINKLRKK